MRTAALLSLVLVLSGCAALPVSNSPESATGTDTPTVIPTPEPDTDPYSIGRERSADDPHYDKQVTVTYEGNGSINVTARAYRDAEMTELIAVERERVEVRKPLFQIREFDPQGIDSYYIQLTTGDGRTARLDIITHECAGDGVFDIPAEGQIGADIGAC
jgi:hypothetical protein